MDNVEFVIAKIDAYIKENAFSIVSEDEKPVNVINAGDLIKFINDTHIEMLEAENRENIAKMKLEQNEAYLEKLLIDILRKDINKSTH